MSKKHGPSYPCAGWGWDCWWPADHLRSHNNEPWCTHCWDEQCMVDKTGIGYSELPPFVPEAEQKIKALEEGLKAIQRHMEFSKTGALSNVWHIAAAALNKAGAIGK